MSTRSLPDISLAALAQVCGGAGSLPAAIGRYFTTNGDGNVLSKTAAVGAKVGRRLEYSLGITRSVDDYANQVRALPGGAQYLDEVKALRP